MLTTIKDKDMPTSRKINLSLVILLTVLLSIFLILSIVPVDKLFPVDIILFIGPFLLLEIILLSLTYAMMTKETNLRKILFALIGAALLAERIGFSVLFILVTIIPGPDSCDMGGFGIFLLLAGIGAGLVSYPLIAILLFFFYQPIKAWIFKSNGKRCVLIGTVYLAFWIWVLVKYGG